jgi:hypothetical protein
VDDPQPQTTSATTRQRIYGGLALALVILFLMAVSQFYHRGTGFTAFIGFPKGHESEAPAMRGVPHFDYPAWASYDGQFYAQRALDPLCRDPLTDRAMDLAPFRARRILFSWTAYAIGLGRPVWILEVYALQNVACWLLLAWLLTRWIPPVTARGLALWVACVLAHGVLWSVRFALLDVPSLVLIVCAVRAVEAGRPLLSAAIVGLAGLGRETNLLAAAAQPFPWERRRGPNSGRVVSLSNHRGWMRLAVAIVLAGLPLLLWEDYLRSIYRATIFAGTDTLSAPGTALAARWMQALGGLRAAGIFSAAWLPFSLLSSLMLQAVYVLVRWEYQSAWWRVAVAYVALMLVLDHVLADPHTGAITRVLLPLTVGFNILLASESRPVRFWLWFTAGNLHLLSAYAVM